MIKKIMIFYFCVINVVSANIIDLYGTNSNTTKEVMNEYAGKVNKLEEYFLKNHTHLGQDELYKLFLKKNDLINEIKKKWQFSFVSFQTVYYPDHKKYYTTIEVIDKSQPQRLQFVDIPIRQAHQKNPKQDLIKQMIDFEKIEMDLLISNQLNLKNNSCPVYHCVSGFHHPALKPYLKVFNEGAIKQRKLILDTLNNDKDPQRRAAAVFLMGHFKDPREIITTLTRHVNDKDGDVRNNLMRVLVTTMEKSRIKNLDLEPFIALLNSPYLTDRNKALQIIAEAADLPKTKLIITQKSGDKLIDFMQLKQPNNHDVAYLILKKISGKNFGEKNISSWKKWVSSNKKIV